MADEEDEDDNRFLLTGKGEPEVDVVVVVVVDVDDDDAATKGASGLAMWCSKSCFQVGNMKVFSLYLKKLCAL